MTHQTSRRNGVAVSATGRTAGNLAAGLVVAIVGLGQLASVASAASVAPVPIDSGNPTCADLAPAGTTWQEFRLQGSQLGDGTNTDGVITVTIAGFSDSIAGTPGRFDWASDLAVDAVFVKADSVRHHLYTYSPAAVADAGLGPQAGTGNGISHINVCYDPTTDPTTDPAPDNGRGPAVVPLNLGGQGTTAGPEGDLLEGAVLALVGGAAVQLTPPPSDTLAAPASTTADSARLIVLGLVFLTAAGSALIPVGRQGSRRQLRDR